MNEIELKKILSEAGEGIKPSLSWKKNARENVMFFARTHIPVVSAKISFFPRIAVSLVSVVIVLIVAIPITDTLASESKPGDVLYPIARFFEKAKIALAGDLQKKDLMKELLQKRVDEFEYVTQHEDSQHEQESAQELITHTQGVIDNERFTLEEKREIAREIKDRLDDIEQNSQKESVSQSIDTVNTILSQTEVKIEHKNAEVQGEKDDTGVGGLDEKESEKIPQELKKLEDNSKLPL